MSRGNEQLKSSQLIGDGGACSVVPGNDALGGVAARNQGRFDRPAGSLKLVRDLMEKASSTNRSGNAPDASHRSGTEVAPEREADLIEILVRQFGRQHEDNLRQRVLLGCRLGKSEVRESGRIESCRQQAEPTAANQRMREFPNHALSEQGCDLAVKLGVRPLVDLNAAVQRPGLDMLDGFARLDALQRSKGL